MASFNLRYFSFTLWDKVSTRTYMMWRGYLKLSFMRTVSFRGWFCTGLSVGIPLLLKPCFEKKRGPTWTADHAKENGLANQEVSVAPHSVMKTQFGQLRVNSMKAWKHENMKSCKPDILCADTSILGAIFVLRTFSKKQLLVPQTCSARMQALHIRCGAAQAGSCSAPLTALYSIY